MGSLSAMKRVPRTVTLRKPPTAANRFPRVWKDACFLKDRSGAGGAIGGRAEKRHGLLRRRKLEGIAGAQPFLRITSAGLRESHVNNVIITREAPNYQVE